MRSVLSQAPGHGGHVHDNMEIITYLPVFEHDLCNKFPLLFVFCNIKSAYAIVSKAIISMLF